LGWKGKIGVLGAGRMGSALVKGFLGSGFPAKDILVSDKDEARLRHLAREGVRAVSDNLELVKGADAIFVAVKPGDVRRTLDEIKGLIGSKLIVSVAAGVPIRKLEEKLEKAKVIRAMPNLPCQVREGAIAYSRGKLVSGEDARVAGELLGRLGVAVELSEDMLDVATGLSGSGPAYFYLAIDALTKAAVEDGMPREVALKLAAQTAKGAGETLLKTGATPQELIDAVRSPKGTTERGLEALEKRGVAKAFGEALRAAAKRARELAG